MAPGQLVPNLGEEVAELQLPHGLENSLQVKLDAASESIEAGNARLANASDVFGLGLFVTRREGVPPAEAAEWSFFSEFRQGVGNLNGDGDSVDDVLHVYDALGRPYAIASALGTPIKPYLARCLGVN